MKQTHKIAVSVLTGAGASRAMGYPLATDIHTSLFEDTNVAEDLHGNFYFLKKGEFHLENSSYSVEGVRETLRAIRVICDSYSGNNTNYEDWFYILEQVHNSLSKELDNLLVTPFLEKLAEILPKHLTFAGSDGPKQMIYSDIESRCKKACRMINDIVRIKLSSEPKTKISSKLAWLRGLTCDGNIDLKAVMTLNQDCVLERFFEEESIDWTDGFSSTFKSSEESEWNPTQFDFIRVSLLKLHGSIDWYRTEEKFHDVDNNRTRLKSIRYYKSSAQPSYIGNRNTQTLALIGRHNKALSYSGPLFNELHTIATRTLADSDVLIVVGYSFMDKFINRMIINWLYSGGQRKLVTVTPHLYEINRSQIQDIAVSLGEWENRNDLGFIESLSENLSWKKLKSSMLK